MTGSLWSSGLNIERDHCVLQKKKKEEKKKERKKKRDNFCKATDKKGRASSLLSAMSGTQYWQAHCLLCYWSMNQVLCNSSCSMTFSTPRLEVVVVVALQIPVF